MSNQSLIPKHVEAFISSNVPKFSDHISTIKGTTNLEELSEMDMQLGGAESAIRVLRGYVLLQMQDMCDGRTFSEQLVKAKISRRTAYDYIDEALVFERTHSLEECQRLNELGSLRIRALKKWDDETLHAFLGDEAVRQLTFDDALEMPAKDFAKVAKTEDALFLEKQKTADLELKLKQAKETIAYIENSAKQELLNTGEKSEALLNKRVEANLLVNESCLNIADLYQLLEGADSDLNQDDLLALAEMVYLHTGSILNSALASLTKIESIVPDIQEVCLSSTSISGAKHKYTEAELRAFADQHHLMMQDREARKLMTKQRAERDRGSMNG